MTEPRIYTDGGKTYMRLWGADSRQQRTRTCRHAMGACWADHETHVEYGQCEKCYRTFSRDYLAATRWARVSGGRWREERVVEESGAITVRRWFDPDGEY